MLSYPTEISKDGDFFLVSLRYFYGEEPVTQGKKYEEALAMAADWLLSVATIAKEKQDELQSLLSPKTEKHLIEILELAKSK